MKTRVMMATLKRHPPSHQRHQSPSRARIPQVPSTDLKRPTDAQRQRRREAQAGRGGGRGRHLSSDPSVQALHHTPETWVAVRLQHWMGGSHRVGPTGWVPPFHSAKSLQAPDGTRNPPDAAGGKARSRPPGSEVLPELLLHVRLLAGPSATWRPCPHFKPKEKTDGCGDVHPPKGPRGAFWVPAPLKHLPAHRAPRGSRARWELRGGGSLPPPPSRAPAPTQHEMQLNPQLPNSQAF